MRQLIPAVSWDDLLYLDGSDGSCLVSFFVKIISFLFV